ncbi:hypothetical protein MNBD_GAMMA18-1209 [hydrothermal vent metagenome]|uniref:DUF3619 family protein n=1 Tax=hydrothermal vent metagenome TaxID=652676 RepID=A0A3B0Z2N1_9ZZZZ
MSRDDPQQAFIEQAKTRLDKTEAALDEITQEKLQTARRTALARQHRFGWKMPVAAFASLFFMALLVNSLMVSNELPISVDLFEDIALLSAQEELEMYEDMDLILWLLEEEGSDGLG